MRKKYRQPQTHTIQLHGSVFMLESSNSVNDYDKGNDINVGDTDEPGNVKSHNNIKWDKWDD